MQAQKVNSTTSSQFSQFVKDNNASFLQSLEWGEWQKSLGRKAFQYLVTDDSPLLAAQLIQHQLPLGKYYLYCPYGPVLGKQLAVSSEQLAEASEALFNQLQQDFPDCLFVKLEPISNLALGQMANVKCQVSTRIQPASTLLLDLTKSTEKLQSEMHTKNRYNIRVAERHGVTIEHGQLIAGEEVAKIVELICSTTERQDYNGHPRSYYQKFVEFFSSQNSKEELNVQWYAAFLQGQMLAGAIFVDFGDTRDFLFGGSSAEHKEAMASFLMQWQSIQDAKATGLKVYDFGGTETSSGETPGFVRFKLRFGGTQVQHPGAVDATWHNFQYKLFKLAKKVRF